MFKSGLVPVHAIGLKQAAVDSGGVKERRADVEEVDDQQSGNRQDQGPDHGLYGVALGCEVSYLFEHMNFPMRIQPFKNYIL